MHKFFNTLVTPSTLAVLKYCSKTTLSVAISAMPSTAPPTQIFPQSLSIPRASNSFSIFLAYPPVVNTPNGIIRANSGEITFPPGTPPPKIAEVIINGKALIAPPAASTINR